MESKTAFTCRAFPDEPSAIAAAERVGEVFQEMASNLELSLAGLDGVTIAYDYDVALRELNRGFQPSGPLTATLDDFAGGVAMSPLVMRDGKVKSHILLSAGIVPLIDSTNDGVSGKYIIAHELAHAHEHYFRDKQLPGTLLQQTISGGKEIALFQIAENCWSEYAACIFSAKACPDHGLLYEKTFVAVLRQFRDRILATKRAWMADLDYGKAWNQLSNDITALLRYASYLMGHVAGLDDVVLEEYAKDAWAQIQENAWLLPHFEQQYATLADMINTFDQWKSLDVFNPLKKVVENVFEDCGIPMSQLPNGTLHIWIKDGRLPV
jgi:hypothetical protein